MPHTFDKAFFEGPLPTEAVRPQCGCPDDKLIWATGHCSSCGQRNLWGIGCSIHLGYHHVVAYKHTCSGSGEW